MTYQTSEKSHVSMAVCIICGGDTGVILLDRRLRQSMEMHTVTPEPCDTCRKKYLKKGTLLIERGGRAIVLKDSAFKRIFNIPIPAEKIAFVEEGLLDKLQPNE